MTDETASYDNKNETMELLALLCLKELSEGEKGDSTLRREAALSFRHAVSRNPTKP